MNYLTDQNVHQFLLKLYQQLLLVGLATGVAILIGIPLGVSVARFPSSKKFVIGIANIFQTIPSLALLAFLLPFLGIGIKPAIVTISIYCLLPIVRNTIVGIEGVPPEVKEAEVALGFTFWQKLMYVELPLALPVMIAGVRIATVMAVGVATLAAFIGAGGLGDYITQGLALNNNKLILLGAIPTAFLALFFDQFISWIEKAIQLKHFHFKLISYSIGMVFIAVTLCVLYGGSFICFKNKDPRVIHVASKNFTEQYILGEILALLIENNAHLKVERQFNLGTTEIVHQALVRGDIDIYPEYTGTAYISVLHLKDLHSPGSILKIIKNAYAKKFALTWLDPFGFSNANTLVVTKSFAMQHHLTTLSDLAILKTSLILGSPAEFMERPDGYPGLKRSYGLNFDQIKQMDPGLMYQAIRSGEVNIIAGFSTDGRIPEYGLVPLVDDRNFYPPYDAVPVIRQTLLDQYPEILTALKPLKNLMDDKTMRELNYQVDVEKIAPSIVAHRFLVKKGLLQS